MAKKPQASKLRARDARATVLHSGLAGAAAGMIAATMSSASGANALESLSDVIGIDFLDGRGAASEVPLALAPFSSTEVLDIESRLEASALALESSRAATDEEIAFMRGLAEHRRGGAAQRPINRVKDFGRL